MQFRMGRREFVASAGLAAVAAVAAVAAAGGANARTAGSVLARASAAGPQPVGMKSGPPAKHLFAFRLEDLPVNARDLHLTLHCLQGLVNRAQPQLYLLQDRYDELWLNWLKERGDVETTQFLEIGELFERFGGYATCMFVTDPAIPASVNVATMLAAVHDGLVVTPDMASMFPLPKGAYPDSFKTGADLRVMHWKQDIEAYRWVYGEIGDHLSRRAVAIVDPDTAAIRDYLVQFKVPLLWISSPKSPQRASESFREERDFVREIFMQWPPNIPCMGWPLDGPGIGEWEGVRIASQCAKFEVCSGNDGYSPSVSNLSVHSGTNAILRQRPAPAVPALERDKVHIAFTRTDGDGLNFQRHYYRKLFDDPQHGSVPLGWQIGANAADFNPAILDYYYRHALPGDCFVNALTGVGYIHEDCYADNYPPEQREQIWKEYLELSSRYRARIDASLMVTFSEMEPQRLARFAAIEGIDGVLANYGTTSITTLDNEVTRSAGKPVFRSISSRAPELTFTPTGRRRAEVAMVDEIIQFTPLTRPAFMHVSLSNWLSHLGMLENIVKRLGPTYAPVRPDHLIALYKLAQARA